MSAIIFDTETTGLVEPGLVEAAWVRLPQPKPLEITDRFSSLYNPGKPISAGAMATHHIVPADVEFSPSASSFHLPESDFLIGHNVDFDWQVVGKPEIRRICTKALAQYLWPTNIDSYSQTALLYALIGPSVRPKVFQAHRAMQDVENCLILLDCILSEFKDRSNEIETWGQLHALSEIARIPTHMPFGKHKGVPIAEVPRDYKRWLLGQPDVDPYLVRALTS